ncbi:MAG: hypothetical protein PHV07_08020 [Oscillospiraceae bacterium]|nr:hypothetical protein [Oscillospiraceae bacterium]
MKHIFSAFLCMVLAFALCSCNANDAILNSSSTTQSDYGLDFTTNTSSKPEASQPSDISSIDPADYTRKLNKANIYQTSETIQYDDFAFSNVKLTMSKKLIQGITKDQVDYYKETTDAEGTLTNSQTYAFVTMDITNLTNQ